MTTMMMISVKMVSTNTCMHHFFHQGHKTLYWKILIFQMLIRLHSRLRNCLEEFVMKYQMLYCTRMRPFVSKHFLFALLVQPVLFLVRQMLVDKILIGKSLKIDSLFLRIIQEQRLQQAENFRNLYIRPVYFLTQSQSVTLISVVSLPTCLLAFLQKLCTLDQLKQLFYARRSYSYHRRVQLRLSLIHPYFQVQLVTKRQGGYSKHATP